MPQAPTQPRIRKATYPATPGTPPAVAPGRRPSRTGSAPRAPRVAVLAQTVRTANKVRARLEKAVLRDAGLNWTEYDVLSLVCQHDHLETRQASAIIGIAKSTLTLAMTTLTRRHLVQRVAQPDDKRRVVLRPTVAGVELARHLTAEINAEQDRVLRRLGITEPDRLTVALRALGLQCQDDSAPGAGLAGAQRRS